MSMKDTLEWLKSPEGKPTDKTMWKLYWWYDRKMGLEKICIGNTIRGKTLRTLSDMQK